MLLECSSNAERNASAPVLSKGRFQNDGAMLMPTAKEYRRQAQECLELAKTAGDLYAKQAMAELAEEFNKAADTLERKSAPNRFPREPRVLQY